MNTQDLITKLKSNDTVLPKEILNGSSITILTKQLSSIFSSHKEELMKDVKFRSNYTELVNYVYLVALSKKPDTRNKEMFSPQLTNFLINTPIVA